MAFVLTTGASAMAQDRTFQTKELILQPGNYYSSADETMFSGHSCYRKVTKLSESSFVMTSMPLYPNADPNDFFNADKICYNAKFSFVFTCEQNSKSGVVRCTSEYALQNSVVSGSRQPEEIFPMEGGSFLVNEYTEFQAYSSAPWKRYGLSATAVFTRR